MKKIIFCFTLCLFFIGFSTEAHSQNKETSETIGGTAGAAAGAAIGAAVGSLGGPFSSAAAAGAGGYLGSKAGEAVGRASHKTREAQKEHRRTREANDRGRPSFHRDMDRKQRELTAREPKCKRC